MDMVDFQEKMDPAHRAHLCRMLKMKDLPECLLEVYARVKMLVDCIDARVGVGNLALIAIIAGYNPDTGKFCVTEQPAEELRAQSADEGLDQVVEETLEPPVEQSFNGATGQAQEQTDKETTEAKAESVEAPAITGDQAAEQIASGAAKPVEPAASEKLWSPGMPVNVLQEDELKQGKIVGVHRPEPGSEKPVQLTVEFEDGDTVTVNEDEVEAD